MHCSEWKQANKTASHGSVYGLLFFVLLEGVEDGKLEFVGGECIFYAAW